MESYEVKATADPKGASFIHNMAAQLKLELHALDEERKSRTADADNCLHMLQTHAEEVLSRLSAARLEFAQTTAAAQRRRESLKEQLAEVAHRLDRLEAGPVEQQSFAGAADNCSESRDFQHLPSDASGLQKDIAQQRARLQELQEACRRLTIPTEVFANDSKPSSAAASHRNPMSPDGTSWTSRYKELVSTHMVRSDRSATSSPDHVTTELDQKLQQACAALKDEPEESQGYLNEIFRCVSGLAWAERRRRGLLMERWHELHNSQPDPSRPHSGAAADCWKHPVTSVAQRMGSNGTNTFSPPRALDWAI